MSTDRWETIEHVYHVARGLDGEERSHFLDERCGPDGAMRRQIEVLLAADEKPISFLSRPPVELPADLRSMASVPSFTGRRVGVYEIFEHIGSGGMGDVYRARDTMLARDVAVKMLPQLFALDSERIARFKREAQLLASLNHPNIAAIYGYEESDNVRALVLELVDGPTLADRIALGPIRLEEALPIARQVAEALEAAHEHGIIHRDLKPANIKVRPDGAVKVLDFGLAKALDPLPNVSDASRSPTMTGPAMAEMGVILGTAAYMSPEQAKGRAADKRSDLWAFGCVLYEMLTGRRAFNGEDAGDTLAAVLKGEPVWTALPGEVPPGTAALIRRCLQKDIKKRTRDAGDIVLELEEALSAPATPAAAPATGTPVLSRHPLVVGLAGLLLGGFITGLAVWLWPQKPAPTPPVSRFPMALPPGQQLAGLNLTAITFSLDGKRFAYVASANGLQQLYVQEMDSLEAKPIPGTEGARGPFFSPDGQSLGFFTFDWLKKVSISGGPAVDLAPVDQFGLGGSWGSDGTIVFADGSRSELSRVSDAGGTVQPITKLDGQKAEVSHRLPHHLPGGKAVLFTVGTGGSWDDARIDVLQLDTGKRTLLIERGSDGRYVPTGHLVYLRAGFLMSVPVDLNQLKVTGSPIALIQGVLPSTGNTGAAQATFADTAALMYVSGGGRPGEKTLTWVDRKGTEQPLQLPPHAFQHPRLSSDGQRVVVSIDEGSKSEVWIHDLRRGSFDKVTSEDARFPIWTSDGTKVTFVSTRMGPSALYWKTADGSGTDEPLAPNARSPGSWSPNGDTLAFTILDPTTGLDIWMLSLKDGRKPQPFVRTPSHERNPAFSPNGRWVAYQSNQTGQEEVYIEEFPGPGRKRLVSSQGGGEPVWSRNGRELFYRSGAKMMAVAVANPFEPTKAEVLFERAYARNSPRDYDVAPDGRFLMLKQGEQFAAATRIEVVLNLMEELKQRVPAR